MRTFDYTGVRSDDVQEAGTVNAMSKEEADLVLRSRGLRQVVVRGRAGRASPTMSPGVTVLSPAPAKPTPVPASIPDDPIDPPAASYGHCLAADVTYRMELISRIAAGRAAAYGTEPAKWMTDQIADQSIAVADAIIARLDAED
jgi:hypothetical protein